MEGMIAKAVFTAEESKRSNDFLADYFCRKL